MKVYKEGKKNNIEIVDVNCLMTLKDGGIVDYDMSFTYHNKDGGGYYVYSFVVFLSTYEIYIELLKGDRYPFSGDDFIKLLFSNYILYKNMTETDFCDYVCRFLANYYNANDYYVRIKDMKLLYDEQIKGSENIERMV